MTPDTASGGAADPQSWNRYDYTRGDPVNRFDPNGTDDSPPSYCFDNPDGIFDPICNPVGGACVGADGFTPMPSPVCQVPAPPPPSTPQEATPSCLDGLSQRDIGYVSSNAYAAFDVSAETGDAMSPSFILAWAAVESAFGTSPVAMNNDNYFGEKFLTCNPRGGGCVPNANPNRAAPWKGAVPCSQLGAGRNPGFACFAGSDLFGSAFAALLAHGGRDLKIAQSMPGATPAALAQAIANGGFCQEGNCTAGGYGQAVQSDYNELLPVINCLFPWLW